MGQPLNRCGPVTGIQQCASHLLVLQVESLEETALRLEKTELSPIRRSALKNKYRVRRCAKNRQESVKQRPRPQILALNSDGDFFKYELLDPRCHLAATFQGNEKV